MTLGYALFLIFCTPFGWIGLYLIGNVINAIRKKLPRPMFSELSAAQLAVLQPLLHVEMLEARRCNRHAFILEEMYGEVMKRKWEKAL